MVETDIMEALSRGFIEAIAHRKGFFNLSGKDYGTDLHICQAIPRPGLDPTKQRWFMTGQQLHIQLKSTCEKSVKSIKGNLHYRLSSDNYNDLICRANETSKSIPLILIVFVFPNDRNTWLDVRPEELIFKKHAFWFEIDPSKPQCATPKITIKIPLSNIITSDFFPYIFNYFK